MKFHRNHVAAAIILLTVIVCLVLVRYLGYQAPLAFCTPAAGVITFFAMLTERNSVPEATGSGNERLRQAIAAAMVVQYLVMLGIVAYFLNGAEKLPPVTETMLSSFTTVVSVVVVFYFGASALTDVKTKVIPEDKSAS